MNQRRLSIVVLASLLAAPGCQETANTAATPSPTATKRPSKAPPATAHSTPSATMSPHVSLVARPNPTPFAAPAPADAPPKILSVNINSTNVKSGDTIVGSVLATPNVASVEVRVASYGMTMTKVGTGRFELSYTLGDIPFFLHGTYDMKIIARNTRGDAVSRTLPLTIH